jgi:hypothetical protein
VSGHVYVEALLIPLTHIYMTTHITDLVEALLIPLTHIYMTTHITGLVEAVRGGAHLKNLHRAKGGVKIVGVFRVKNHDFTPTNLIFSDCGGRRENF